MARRALFIYTHPSTFVKGDITILKKRYDVTEYCLRNQPKKVLPLSLVKQFFYLLFNIYRYNLVYIWFADYHSLFPVLFSRLTGKNCFLVIGGYDVCREKKYGYGSFSNRLRGSFAYLSMRYATQNLCVSKNIERIVAAIAPKSNHTTVYNGVSIKSEFDGTQSKERIVLCVALVSTLQAFYIKGIDRYNSLAEEMSDTHFTLVGCSPDIFTKAGVKKAKNLRIIPALEHSKLALLFSKAKVYCQLSRRESFSLALAEAMYHNCIPVITNTGGMPEVTGGLGYCISPEAIGNMTYCVNPEETGNTAPYFSAKSTENPTKSDNQGSPGCTVNNSNPASCDKDSSISSDKNSSISSDKNSSISSYKDNSGSSAITHCLADAVRKALDEPFNTNFRKHIEQNFSASHREQAILH